MRKTGENGVGNANDGRKYLQRRKNDKTRVISLRWSSFDPAIPFVVFDVELIARRGSFISSKE